MGVEPVFAWAFGDHHTYSSRELHRLADQARRHGAEALLTTRKDSFNLPSDAARVVAPLSIFWLDIEVQVFEEEEFACLIQNVSETH
jgi:tetraacyldisaccharide-1-P 4'-kinase